MSLALVAAVLGAVGTIAGAWAAVHMFRLHRRLLTIEQAREADRTADRVAAQVQVLASPDAPGPRSERRLQLVNRGPAIAEITRVRIDGRPPHAHERVRRGGPMAPFTLTPGASVAYWMLLTGSSASTVHVEVAWTDVQGQGQTLDTALTLD